MRKFAEVYISFAETAFGVLNIETPLNLSESKCEKILANYMKWKKKMPKGKNATWANVILWRSKQPSLIPILKKIGIII